MQNDQAHGRRLGAEQALDEFSQAWDPKYPTISKQWRAKWTLKIVYLAIREASKKWTMPIRNWKAALNHFAILFEGRFPK